MKDKTVAKTTSSETLPQGDTSWFVRAQGRGWRHGELDAEQDGEGKDGDEGEIEDGVEQHEVEVGRRGKVGLELVEVLFDELVAPGQGQGEVVERVGEGRGGRQRWRQTR